MLPEPMSSSRKVLSAPTPTTFVPSYEKCQCIVVVFQRTTLTALQAQFITGPSKSIAAFPSLCPCSDTWYIRTFLSHDATARKSPVGEKLRSATPSSGGVLRATSFEGSPCELAVFADELAALPKRPDMLGPGQLDTQLSCWRESTLWNCGSWWDAHRSMERQST